MRLREGASVGEVAARQWRRAGAAEGMAAVFLVNLALLILMFCLK